VANPRVLCEFIFHVRDSTFRFAPPRKSNLSPFSTFKNRKFNPDSTLGRFDLQKGFQEPYFSESRIWKSNLYSTLGNHVYSRTSLRQYQTPWQDQAAHSLGALHLPTSARMWAYCNTRGVALSTRACRVLPDFFIFESAALCATCRMGVTQRARMGKQPVNKMRDKWASNGDDDVGWWCSKRRTVEWNWWLNKAPFNTGHPHTLRDVKNLQATIARCNTGFSQLFPWWPAWVNPFVWWFVPTACRSN